MTRSVTGGGIARAVLWNSGRVPFWDQPSPLPRSGRGESPWTTRPGAVASTGAVALPTASLHFRASLTPSHTIRGGPSSRIEQASRSILRDHWSCKVPSDAEGGVAPLWWTPASVVRRYPLCRNRDRRIRRPSGARWSSRFAPDGHRRSWPESSNPQPRRSAIRPRGPTVTKAGVVMDRAANGARRCAVCVKNGRYWQEPRLGLLRRSDPGGLSVHEGESGPIPDGHDGPSARSLPKHERAQCVGCSARERCDEVLTARVRAVQTLECELLDRTHFHDHH